MAIAYLVHGYLGAGKTTFAKTLESETGALRLTIDELVLALFGQPATQAEQDVVYLRVYNLVDDLWPRMLRAGAPVILDFGFWTRKSRDQARRLAGGAGGAVKLYAVRCPELVARERCRRRNEERANGTFRVSDGMYDELARRFEPLQPDEPHEPVETGGS